MQLCYFQTNEILKYTYGTSWSLMGLIRILIEILCGSDLKLLLLVFSGWIIAATVSVCNHIICICYVKLQNDSGSYP